MKDRKVAWVHITDKTYEDRMDRVKGFWIAETEAVFYR